MSSFALYPETKKKKKKHDWNERKSTLPQQHLFRRLCNNYIYDIENLSISLIKIMCVCVRFFSERFVLCVWSAFCYAVDGILDFNRILFSHRAHFEVHSSPRDDKNGNDAGGAHRVLGVCVRHVVQFICIIINSYIFFIVLFFWALLSIHRCCCCGDIVTAIVILSITMFYIFIALSLDCSRSSSRFSGYFVNVAQVSGKALIQI